MEENQLNTTAKYRVVKADRKQIDLLFDNYYKNETLRSIAIVFLAIADDENIIGYFVAEEKSAPPSINGYDWFIWQVFARPDLSRQGVASALLGVASALLGVASALLNEAIEHARQANIRHFVGSSNPTLMAQMFWFKHGFCSIPYAKKQDDANQPLTYGNYSQIISYRIAGNAEKGQKEGGYRILKADKEQLSWIFEEYILKESLQFFRDKRDDIFALTAADESKNILGFIAAYPCELYAPLDGAQWMIPYIFVRTELRRQGIGSALIGEIIRAAKELGVKQLTCLDISAAESEFWENNNFDIRVWYIARTMDGKMPVSAAKRI